MNIISNDLMNMAKGSRVRVCGSKSGYEEDFAVIRIPNRNEIELFPWEAYQGNQLFYRVFFVLTGISAIIWTYIVIWHVLN